MKYDLEPFRATFAITALMLLATSVQAEALPIKKHQLYSKDTVSFFHKVKIDREAFVPPALVNRPVVYNGKVGNDCLAEGGGCSQSLIFSSTDVENSVLEYGLFSVVGTGLRLPDDQLESDGGLEDEWSLN